MATLTKEEARQKLANIDPNKQLEGDTSKLDEMLTSQSLKETKPFDIVEKQPDIETAGFQGQLESIQDDFTKETERKAQDTEARAKDSLQAFLSEIVGQEGETELFAKEAERVGGVDDIQKEKDDIMSQIRAEQHSLRRQIERIETGAGTATKAQRDISAGEATRQSLRKQADLSIILQGIQGRYDSAKAIADRAVQVQLEGQRKLLTALQLNYEFNKDLFTTAEQRYFETKQADRERALNKQEAETQAIYDIALEAQKEGAPSSVISAITSSTSKEQALASAGSYIGATARAAAGLSNRLKLFELASKGDTNAIRQIGYDPRQFTPEYQKELQAAENSFNSTLTGFEQVTKLLENEKGLDIITTNLVGGRFFEAIGNAGRGIRGDEQGGFGAKNDALASAKYVLENLTLEKLGKLETPLTPVSNADINIVRSASGVLTGYAQYDIDEEKSEFKGFKGDLDSVKSAITDLQEVFSRNIDRYNAVQGLAGSDLQELELLLTQ